MVINEDYFRDVEINDENITIDDNGLSANEHLLHNVEELKQHLLSKYEKYIKVNYTSYYGSFINKQDFYTRYLPKVLKRIHNVLDLYNAEYEIILTDSSFEYSRNHSNRNIQIYNINGYNILSALQREEQLYDDDTGSKSSISIIAFVNLPEFTYKQSYFFYKNLTDSIWRKNGLTEYLESSVLSISDCTEEIFDYSNGKKNHYTFCTTIFNYLSSYDPINGKSYRKDIHSILNFFHNKPGDMKKISKIISNIKNCIDPFDDEHQYIKRNFSDF